MSVLHTLSQIYVKAALMFDVAAVMSKDFAVATLMNQELSHASF